MLKSLSTGAYKSYIHDKFPLFIAPLPLITVLTCPIRRTAGDPFTEQLIGPSSVAWSQHPGDYGKIAYVTTDGGTASPLSDGTRRTAKVLRVEFQEPPNDLRS